MTDAPVAYFWGDDELSAARAIDRFALALAADAGGPMERWDILGERNAAADILARLHERVATSVMFGGGTLAVVSKVGPLLVKGEHRDAFLALVALVAPGNALAILDASPAGARGPSQKRLAGAVAAAGGTVREF